MVRPIHTLRTASYGAVLVGALVTAGCFDPQKVDPGTPPRPVTRVETEPNGWVQKEANADLGINGFWYSYGDQYDEPRRCTVYGKHSADECSMVTLPNPLPALDFPNTGGKMCTYGSAAQVIDCVTGQCDGLDYSNMWGAGIGLDFNLDVQGDNPNNPPTRDPTPPTRAKWDAPGHGVVGVAFDFSWTDYSVDEPGQDMSEPYVRVEFPVELPDEGLETTWYTVLRDHSVIPAGSMLAPGTASEEHPSGSPFVDAPPDWGAKKHVISSVRQGHNEFLWSEVQGPPDSNPDQHASGPVYPFEPSKLLGILFQVPPLTDQRLPYGFCVENFAFLGE